MRQNHDRNGHGEPHLLLADEPTTASTSLFAGISTRWRSFVAKRRWDLLVSHDLAVVARVSIESR
jgi:ABC-type glutathione transport system ATPase component